ncbi:unnamed protein product [Clonostachys rhizophaga]|uniref:Zn(2)-C6 fungal-type domain-containing protein n=1 Tax=Clonostachys rhizophaga TaxID=160324 RepID=A0A9N9V535_9HYPO|nr:unnamed protein product [Clonostachys rhizophaga]
MVNNGYSCQQDNFRFTPFQSEYRPPYASPDSRSGKPNWPPTPNAHGAMTGADDEVTDESNTNRKRIAVACGRCRKRKIRCSGDNGTGEPCLNCRNAGTSPCQFLRVSSLETNLKDSGRPSQVLPYEGYSRSYPGCAEEARARLAAQSTAPLPSMYQETGSPSWAQDPFSSTTYKSGQGSPEKPYSWTTGTYYCQLPEADASSPDTFGNMYAQVQDARCQLVPHDMAPMKHFSYLNSDPGSYTFTPQPTTAMSTTAAMVDRSPGASGSSYPLNTIPHGLLPSLMTEKLHLHDTASSNDQGLGSKSSPSSTSSLQPLTPSTSYGSYTTSPGSAYSGMIPTTQGESAHTYNGLVGTAAPLPTQFPHPPTSTYVYTDMSAQAAALAASSQRVAQAGSSPVSQFQAQQSLYPDGLSEVERKPPTMN